MNGIRKIGWYCKEETWDQGKYRNMFYRQREYSMLKGELLVQNRERTMASEKPLRSQQQMGYKAQSRGIAFDRNKEYAEVVT